MTENRKRESSFSSTEGYNGDAEIVEDCSLEKDTVECENKLGSFTWPSPFFAFATASGISRRRRRKKSHTENDVVISSAVRNFERSSLPDAVLDSSNKYDGTVPEYHTNSFEEKNKDEIVKEKDTASFETQLKFQQQGPSLQLVERLRCEYFEWCQMHKLGAGFLDPSDFASAYKNANMTLCKMSVLSCHHVLLEDALSFANHPRLLIQAEYPYTIVHANAAFAQMRARAKKDTIPYLKRVKDIEKIQTVSTSTTNEKNEYLKDNEVKKGTKCGINGIRNGRSVMGIILDSCCPCERLALYPVYKEEPCGDREKEKRNHVSNTVTHFLVEIYCDKKNDGEKVHATVHLNEETEHFIEIGGESTRRYQDPKQVVG